MPLSLRPQPGILDIELYVAGKASASPGTEPVKLSANENPFGPSPKAIEAYHRAAFNLHRYPGTDHRALREAIGAAHGIDPARIICGVGSDEILHLLAQAYIGPGDEAIMTRHGFMVYPIVTRAAGGRPVVVEERERVTDVEAILAAVTPKTRLVYLANPNNPTGTMIGGNALARLADGLPDHVMLVLDGAYAEFVEGYDGGLSVMQSRDNVFMTRTFSKLYGLGGLRVGWGHGPQEVIDVLNRIRGPFNLSEPQMAAAIAALGDREHIDRSLAENTRLRAWLAKALAEVGVPSDTSCTNFILARFADRAEAEACDRYLQDQGIIVRQVAGYGLPNCLRITVGDEASCRRVAHAVAQFKAAQGQPVAAMPEGTTE
ncbi:histidinol-phosphate transaminase [Frigidibacter sp. ROC022]|uniref:histidinol-phosphate transaminase n=1 Tax=Frigidibacter sp. ROC022 TaxID=2971796 RepID=UPI00215A6AA7|nr:histidinol-phosphate transaminase [Frigidibacter sp. ROC022]MCR8722915.1 histidinol-phosphate transaminase [Frigidibacter sp. ROC022]